MGELVRSAIYALLGLVHEATGAVVDLFAGYGVDPFAALSLFALAALVLSFAL